MNSTQFWQDHWQSSIHAHANHFLEWTESFVEQYDTLATEHDNLLQGMTHAYEEQQWGVLIDFASFLCRPERGYLGLRGYWRELEKQLSRAIQAARYLEFRDDQAALQQNLAILHMRYGHMEEAKKLCHEALTHFQDKSDPIQIAETRGLLATIARLQGDTHQAKKELLALLEVFQALNDEKNVAITLNQLGQLAESTWKWEQALAYHKAELQIEEQTGNHHGTALAKWSIGNVQYRLGNLVAADQYYQQAYDVLFEIGDQQNLIRLLAQRASLTSRIGKITDAIYLFKKLVSKAQELGDQLTAYDAMFNLARLYRLEGQLSEAVAILECAIQIAEAAQLKDLENDKQALQIIQHELATGKTPYGKGNH